jgi:heavy metal translocating P-type ATPase
MIKSSESQSGFVDRRTILITIGAALGIALHLLLRYVVHVDSPAAEWPLYAVVLLGGAPLVAELAVRLWHGEFGSDLLAALSIITGVLLHEWLAASIIVLMLAGGAALEAYAVRRASRVLEALARRVPSTAHRRRDGTVVDVPLTDVAVGDELLLFPHEICPADGVVVEGRSVMDESYLTGEPYAVSKVPGVKVISGAVNGEGALTIRAERRPQDSRYARIMNVMRESEQKRPRLRRIGDRLGAWYLVPSVLLAVAAWWISGDPTRFLAVLVVATPCPLLIAIPVAILGATSAAAGRGIIIKNPAILEEIDLCRTMIFDKTGTLTYGEPQLTTTHCAAGFHRDEVLALAAGVERYSKHPLARAVTRAADEAHCAVLEATDVAERSGDGLRGTVNGRRVRITGRTTLQRELPEDAASLPPRALGLECIVLVDDRYAATLQFRDEPRRDGASFIHHLGPRHQFQRLLIISGDRREEVEYLAHRVGIDEIYAEQSPEQKLELVKAETARAKTAYLGDGINDAPALTAATVGLAFGRGHDVTSEAADAVVLETSLRKVDELLHIGRRLRRVALESAVGGMLLSLGAMAFAAAGYLPPTVGAMLQEVVDVVAVLNALRAAQLPRAVSDY